jgi:hypothetical protein
VLELDRTLRKKLVSIIRCLDQDLFLNFNYYNNYTSDPLLTFIQLPHTHYVISGRLKVKLDDGTEEEFGHGDIAYVPPGHNSWVIGNEPLIIVDFSGFKGQN